MDANYISGIISFCLFAVVLLLWVVVMIRFLVKRFAPVRRVSAVVVDVYREKPASKIHGSFSREIFIVVFSVGEKRLSFRVSEFSFSGYRVGDKGRLQYRGNKLIDFS